MAKKKAVWQKLKFFYKDVVYVFGGYSGKNLSSSEKYDLKTERWTEIADMPINRSAFSVVVHNGFFYMTGDNKNLDKYNPKTNTFETFYDILPEPAGYSTLAFFENTLFVIQNSNCWAIDIESLTITQSSPIPQGKWWSSFSAYVFENEIYFSRYDDSYIWSYNILNKSITRKYKI